MIAANRITARIFDGLSTTEKADRIGALSRARRYTFGSVFPGGLFESASFEIPFPTDRRVPWGDGDRLVLYGDGAPVWEGEISGIKPAGAGLWQLSAGGYWGRLLGRRVIDKRWADDRITEWDFPSAAGSAQNFFDFDYKGRVRMEPRGIAYTNGQGIGLRYTMPTGQTIARVVCDRELNEGAQVWELRLRDFVGAVDVWSLTATTTDTNDSTLGTPRQALQIEFIARANQTPVEDSVIHGQIAAIMVYSETGAIDGEQIAGDIIGLISDLSPDDRQIGALTKTLEPFYTLGPEPAASILARAVSYGDANDDPWAAYLLESDRAAAPDGRPVLAVQPWPDTAAGYDLIASGRDPAIHLPVIRRESADSVNWIAVKYQDAAGRAQVLTPDDDSTLTTGEAPRRDITIDAGPVGADLAAEFGRRYLAAHSAPAWVTSGPIAAFGSIETEKGMRRPVSQIRAGQRIRIADLSDPVAGLLEAGQTFVITRATFDDETGRAELEIGTPDHFALYLAQRALIKDRAD